MLELISSDGLMPHGYCYLWKPGLIWLHLVSDLLIGLAYTTIPFTLVYFIRRRRDVPFRWLFLWFGLFIVSCGGTHVFEAWNLYHADYWLAGLGKAFTALASLVTAFLLVRIVPEAISLPSPHDLELANAGLRVAHEELERRVAERTFELSRANTALSFQAQLLRSVQNIVLAFDGLGRIAYWNARAEENLGWSGDEVQGRGVWDLLASFEQDEARGTGKGSAAALAAGEVWEGERPIGRRDGSTFPAWVTQSPTRAADGTIAGAVWLVVDLTEARRTESSLRESEQVRSIFAHAAVGLAVSTLAGRFVQANPALCTFLGRTEQELLSTDFESVVHPEDLPAKTALVRRVLADEIPGFTVEQRYLRKDGEVVWAQTSVTLVRDTGGEPQSMVALVQDVTRRRRTEAALRESEERYRALVETAREMLITVDLVGRFTSFNAAFTNLTGWEAAQWRGRSFDGIVHPDDLTACRAVFAAAVRGEAPPSLTHRVRSREGEFLSFETTATPQVRDGRVVAVQAVARDVTARVRAEQALSDSRRWLQALYDNALDAILVADDAGRYVDANPAATELLGYSREELLALSVRDVTPFEGRAQLGEAWHAFLEQGRYSGEYQLLRKDAGVRDVEVQATANIVPGLHVSIARDITDRRRAEEELRRKERLFEEAEEVAHVGCWEWDLETNSLIWSAENYRLFGVKPTEFVPNFENFQERVHPEDRTHVVGLNQRAIREGGDFAYDCRVVRPNGDVRHMHARGHGILNEVGRVARLVGIAQDTTDRKRDEEVRRSLMNRLLSNQEEEQARMSRELHDGPCQSLTAALVGLRRIEDATSLRRAKETAAEHRELLVQAIEELGRLARGLRPTVLDDLGLGAALQRHAADVARCYGMDVRLEAKELGRLPRDFETALYRTVQEALSNIARHAAARHVWIWVLREEGTVELMVTDDGRGFEVDQAGESRDHLGLQSIRERAELLGGRADILSRLGKGTTVTVTLPLPTAEPRRAPLRGRVAHRPPR